MLKIAFSEADIKALQYWRFHHPDPRVQVPGATAGLSSSANERDVGRITEPRP